MLGNLRKIKWCYRIFLGVWLPLFFSCENNAKEVSDFLAHRNLPLGILEEVNHVYKDSGRVTMKLYAREMMDFTNRKKHPYQEFPEGVHIVKYTVRTKDSTTVLGKYAVNYTKTGISKIRDSVRVFNHKDKARLETDLLYWDQKRGYYFTQSPFLLITYALRKKDSTFVWEDTDTIAGIGFESREDLSLWEMQKTRGVIQSKKE